MKTSTIIDVLFILACGIILVTLNEFGYSNVISNYSIVFMLVAYFTGKFVRGLELKKKSE